VSAFRYLPFAVFCYASPALSVLYGITGFKIEKTGVATPAAGPQEPTAISADGPAQPGHVDVSADNPGSARQEAGE